jgi:hypothetical protein
MVKEGKKYWTRSGLRAVVHRVKFDKARYPARGAIEHRKGVWHIATWAKDGTFLLGDASPFDLVQEGC